MTWKTKITQQKTGNGKLNPFYTVKTLDSENPNEVWETTIHEKLKGLFD